MGEIRVVNKRISLTDLKEVARERFGDMVKAVVDIERKIMAIGGEMHADEEAEMLENGSKQENLWGINLYPADFGKENFIEYDSMINIRPKQNNRSRDVEDDKKRWRIISVVKELISYE